MLVFRFSDEHLDELLELLEHSTDTFCLRNDGQCVFCEVEEVCRQLADIFAEAKDSKSLCVTVTREK